MSKTTNGRILLFTSPYKFWVKKGGSSNRMLQMLYFYHNLRYFDEITILLDNTNSFLFKENRFIRNSIDIKKIKANCLHINYLSSVNSR